MLHRAPRNLRSAPSLESLEDRCIPAGLQLTSLLAPTAIPALVSSVTAPLDRGLDIVRAPVLETALTIQIGSLASVNVGVSLGGGSQLLSVDLRSAVGGTPLLDLGVQAGKANGALINLDLHAAVGGDKLLNVGVGSDVGGQPGVVVKVGVDGAGSGLLPVGAGIGGSQSGHGVNVGVSVTGRDIPTQEDAPVQGNGPVGQGAIPVAVSPPPVLPPVTPAQLLTGSVASALDFTHDTILPGASETRVDTPFPSSTVASEVRAAPPAVGGAEDEIESPDADAGNLVTNFQVTGSDPSLALDQLFGQTDNGSAPSSFSLIWKLSPALLVVMAASLEVRRRRRRSASVTATDESPEWFPGLAELPNG